MSGVGGRTPLFATKNFFKNDRFFALFWHFCLFGRGLYFVPGFAKPGINSDLSTDKQSVMPHPAMTGDLVLQNYLRDQYWAFRNAGYSKADAHSLAFQKMLEAKAQGYIVEDQPQQVDPYTAVLYEE